MAKAPFTETFSGYAVAGDNQLVTTTVAAGMVRRFSHISVINQNTVYKKLRVIKNVTVGGIPQQMVVFEQNDPKQDQLYWTSDPLELHEGQYVIALLRGCVAGDTMICWIDGVDMTEADWQAGL